MLLYINNSPRRGVICIAERWYNEPFLHRIDGERSKLVLYGLTVDGCESFNCGRKIRKLAIIVLIMRIKLL